MPSDKISSSDIFDDKLFEKINTDAESFKTTLDALSLELKEILAQQTQFLRKQKSFNTADEINKTNQAINNSKTARQGLAAVQQQLINLEDKEVKGKIKFNQANATQRKELKDLIVLENQQAGTLEKLLARNRRLRRERDKLNLNTKEGAKRLIQINSLLDKNNAKIRANSDALKRQRLNVGNYTSALKRGIVSLRNFAGALGLVTGAAALVAVFRSGINIFRRFEQAQTDVASILQKTREETQSLTQAAKDFGATTFFTATEVSKLQLELAKLGFNINQIEDSTGGILNLAAAFGTDLARAAKIAAGTINGFNLEASESGRVADVMANAFSNSALDLEKFEVSVSKVAPIAASLNIDLETTTAVLGQLAKANFDASTAGTQFRNILLKLSNPTSELANKIGFTVNSSEDLIKAFRLLNDEQLNVSDTQKLIDVRSVAILQNLADNIDGVEKLTEANRKQGTALEIAQAQLKTFDGSLRLLSSAYEGFALSVEDGDGAIAQFLKTVVQVVTGVFNLLGGTEKTRQSFEALSPEVQRVAENIVIVVKAVKSAVATVFDFRKAILFTIIAIKSYRVALLLANVTLLNNIKTSALARIATIAITRAQVGSAVATVNLTRAWKLLTVAMAANPIGLIAVAISAIITAILLWTDVIGDNVEEQRLLNAELREGQLELDAYNKRMRELDKAYKEVSTRGEIFKTILGRTNKTLQQFETSSLIKANQNATAELAEEEKKKLRQDVQRIGVLKKIIGALKEELDVRGVLKEGVEGETGLLNDLRARLKETRAARDSALNEGDIALRNKEIEALQEEIKELENLGLAEKKLAKIRLDLDKDIIKSRAEAEKSFRSVDISQRQKELDAVNKDLDENQKRLKEFVQFLDDTEAEGKVKGRGIFSRRVLISDEEADEFTDFIEEQRKEQIKLSNESFKLRQESLENDFEIEQANIKAKADLRESDFKKDQQKIIDTKASEEEKNKALAKLEEARSASIAEEQAARFALSEEFQTKNIELAEEEKNAQIKINEEATDSINAFDKKLSDARIDQFADELKATEEFIQQVISLYQQKADEQSAIEQKRLAEETRLNEQASDRQFQLAVAGQENTFAFQENRAAESRKRQLQAERDAQKEQEALRLVSLYLTALEGRFAEAASNAKLESGGSGVNNNNAPFFALKDAFLGEALSQAIVGNFATGVEDFRGKGTTTSDSNLIGFSNHESVVTAQGTSDNKGLVTAMNNGTVDDYFAKVWMPKFQMDNAMNSIQLNYKGKDETNGQLLSEFKDLASAIKERPIQQVHVDSFGNLIETSWSNGAKSVVTHKRKSRL